MKITSDENVNQAVEQMVQAIRNTDAYLEYRRQLDLSLIHIFKVNAVI